jgi:hypothetical protein
MRENDVRKLIKKPSEITKKMAVYPEGKNPPHVAEMNRKTRSPIFAMQGEWFRKGMIAELVPAAACPSGSEIWPQNDGEAAKGVLDARP